MASLRAGHRCRVGRRVPPGRPTGGPGRSARSLAAGRPVRARTASPPPVAPPHRPADLDRPGRDPRRRAGPVDHGAVHPARMGAAHGCRDPRRGCAGVAGRRRPRAAHARRDRDRRRRGRPSRRPRLECPRAGGRVPGIGRAAGRGRDGGRRPERCGDRRGDCASARRGHPDGPLRPATARRRPGVAAGLAGRRVQATAGDAAGRCGAPRRAAPRPGPAHPEPAGPGHRAGTPGTRGRPGAGQAAG